MPQGLGIAAISVVPAGQFASSIFCSRELAAQRMVLGRTVQQGEDGFSVGCATYPDPAPQTVPFLPLRRTPPTWCFLGDFIPFSAVPSLEQAERFCRERVAAGSRRSMQTTFPTLHAFAAGATWLLADIGSFFCFHSPGLCDLSF